MRLLANINFFCLISTLFLLEVSSLFIMSCVEANVTVDVLHASSEISFDVSDTPFYHQMDDIFDASGENCRSQKAAKLTRQLTVYYAQGIHSIFCGLIAPEASGWFRNRIRTVEDLKGLKMRFFGLGAKVMRKLGVETVELTSGDIFVAFESGDIDAAEFSMPAVDLKLELFRMAKNYYFPGWHQPSTLFELMINLDKWQALSPTNKAQIEAVCGDNIRYGLAEGEAVQFNALKELQKKGVVLRRWPNEILEALESAWQEVVAEEADANRDFKRVWQSLSAFRKEQAIWRELNRLN